MQPIKELSSAAGRCAGRGCALIRQLANCLAVRFRVKKILGSNYNGKIASNFDTVTNSSFVSEWWYINV